MPLSVATSALSQFGPRDGGLSRLAIVIVTVSLLLWTWTGASAAVFGTDDRKPLPASMQTLALKIGTLTSLKSGAVCSAFCAAPDVIVTASHCLFGTAASAKPDQARLQFRLGSGDDRDVSALAGAHAGAIGQPIISGTQRLSVTPPIDAASDWAVARLEAPVCRAGGLALSQKSRTEVDAIAEAGGVFEVAVHRDIPFPDLMLGRPCALPRQFPSADPETIARDFLAPGGVLFHTCDTGGGSSGSPLLIEGADGPEVIGINVGTYVLSRMVPRGSGKHETEQSEAIANTAVETARFADAVAKLRLGPLPIAGRNARVTR